MVSGDLNPPPIQYNNHTFIETNVTSWDDLSALFDLAKQKHGRIDHAFANAGIAGRASFLEENLDANGKLQEPNHLVNEINLKAVLNTSALAFHHFRHQDPAGGSVVATASASSFTRFRIVDYTTAKHGVLGFIRGMTAALQAEKLPIRVNGIAPNWTATAIISKETVDFIKATGAAVQGPDVVARSVAVLMADEKREGELIYSNGGEYWEIEGVAMKYAQKIMGNRTSDDDLNRIVMLGDLQHAGNGDGVQADGH